MWPEVYVGRWVGLDPKWLAVDQKTGEYYTDATHLKLGESALDADIFIEMGRAISEVIGKLKLEILDYSESLPEPGIRGLSARSILKHFRFRD
jgi:hypothetical protein